MKTIQLTNVGSRPRAAHPRRPNKTRLGVTKPTPARTVRAENKHLETKDDESCRRRLRAAARKTTSAKTLTRLAFDVNVDVRRLVASNPNAPTKALTKLARDESPRVRTATALNAGTPSERSSVSQMTKTEQFAPLLPVTRPRLPRC